MAIYSPKITAHKFVEPLAALGPFLPARRDKPVPLPREDCLVELLCLYDMGQVDLGFFRFQSELETADNLGLCRFSGDFNYDYFIKEGTHEIYTFFFMDLFPTPASVESDQFLINLLTAASRGNL